MLSFLSWLLFAVVCSTATFHCLSYLLWYYEMQRGATVRARRSGAYLWFSWIGDWLALTVVILTWPLGLWPGRSPSAGGFAGDPADRSRPVVLLHGWSLNRASMVWIASRLRRDGRRTYSINYPSTLGETDAKAAAVGRALLAIALDAGSDRLDVVAHSLGGVVVRAAARWHGAQCVLGNVVTLGAPHRGSALAVLLRSFGMPQIRPGSRFLARLEEGESIADTVNLTAIASDFDAIVHPLDACYCPSALNVTVEGVGHHAMLFSERIYGLIKENLDTPLKAGPNDARHERDEVADA